MMLRTRNSAAAFSLMETLLVIVIVLIGLAVLFPFLQKALDSYHRTKCLNNLRQLGLACHNFHYDYKTLPPGYGLMNGGTGTAFFYLSPWLEGISNVPLTTAFPVRVFQCPADPSMPRSGVVQGWGASSYAFNAQVFCQVGADGALLSGPDWQQGVLSNGALPVGFAKIPDSFGDGAAQTIIFAERYAQCGGSPIRDEHYANWWAYPFDGHDYCPYFAARTGYVFLNTGNYYDSSLVPQAAMFQIQPFPFQTTACNPHRASTGHPLGMNVGLGDASTRGLKKTMSVGTFWGACTPNGREFYDGG